MILVFAGAGASAAVDPQQYPTTEDFFLNLPGRIKENELFTRIVSIIKKEKEVIDIEDILSYLDELQGCCNSITNPKTSLGWLIKGCGGLIGGVNTDLYATVQNTHIEPLTNMIRSSLKNTGGAG